MRMIAGKFLSITLAVILTSQQKLFFKKDDNGSFRFSMKVLWKKNIKIPLPIKASEIIYIEYG